MTEQTEVIPKLEGKIRELATTRDAVRIAVEALKEQVTILTLEQEVESLEEEVNALLNEKKTLEEKVASFDLQTVGDDIEKAAN